jgi:hypothetical protein
MIQYYDTWSAEKCATFKEELANLKKSLNEKQLKCANDHIRICLMNFDDVYEYVALASCREEDRMVMKYVSRSVDYMKFRCQEDGYYDGLKMGFYADPCL